MKALFTLGVDKFQKQFTYFQIYYIIKYCNLIKSVLIKDV